MATEQLSDQLRMVMERQAALENALMQERQFRAEAEQRLNVALGEVGGRADAAVATASAGTASTLMGAGPNSTMAVSTRGCWENQTSSTVRTRAGGIGSSSRKRTYKLHFQTIARLLLMAEETPDDVRNAALTIPQQGVIVQL